MSNGKPRGGREKLLRAALTCLQEKGYARTTARDLVAASGTNLASIGYHFGSKEALLNEAIAMGFRAWVAEIEQATSAQPATSAGRLERLLAAMIDRFEDLRPLIVSFVEAFPQAVRSPELRERMAQIAEESHAAGADALVRALEADGMTLDPAHAETLSSLHIAVCDGLMLQWLLDPDRAPSASQIMDALAALIPTSFRATRL
jgi:AcrR family transcriptional regulator